MALNKRKYPILEPAGIGLWKVLEDWHYLFKGKVRTIKAGTITDLASIPRGLWVIYPPDGPWRADVLEHDDLYGHDHYGYDRKDSDIHMRQRMKEDGVKWHTRLLFYRAVRRFGGVHRAVGKVKKFFSNIFKREKSS